ncbi:MULTISPECIES: pyridoxal-phosphate dependent enzyme [Cobetia]|uniref:PLP-dependent cysteine synthase family protein n=1 Tax=Cobetia TaxID=204286 RepID=UPI001581C529|nr:MULTISPECIES: pyridoxal-phosphate dependent enzyme [Cobetia]MDI4659648.1 pyridoxal-phosphate dependent enzyme [Cobetia sp. BMC6]NUJ56198.1 pyridoxal-phosphate dependent enzyme [Cobetia marina]
MPTTDFPSTAPFIADADACTHAAQRESWRQRSLMKLAALKAATPATPLLELSLRGLGEARILIKDERAHASGSLKHRLAMSLFEQALQQDWLTPDCPVIEASSGSTAVSEAWLARRLGLQFIAVVPRGTAFYKQEAIRGEGGRVVEIEDSARLCQHAQALADDSGGHFLNQFRHAATAGDWASDTSLPGECLTQITARELPELQAVFLGAGTGGSAASFARHLRHKRHLHQEGHRARVIGVDPEHSVYHACWQHHRTHGTRTTRLPAPQAVNPIEGIGRPCVLEAFDPAHFDDYRRIADARSQEAALWLAEHAGLEVGPSTGTAFAGLLESLALRRARGESLAGSWLLLACDHAERYATTLGDPAWRAAQQSRLAPQRAWLEAFAD